MALWTPQPPTARARKKPGNDQRYRGSFATYDHAKGTSKTVRSRNNQSEPPSTRWEPPPLSRSRTRFSVPAKRAASLAATTEPAGPAPTTTAAYAPPSMGSPMVPAAGLGPRA